MAWGDEANGGDCSEVQERLAKDVKSIYSTTGAFAALKVVVTVQGGKSLPWFAWFLIGFNI